MIPRTPPRRPRPPDPFPGVPRARSFWERRRARRDRKVRKKAALRQLREARKTLLVLVDSDRFAELGVEVEHAKEQVRVAWERWIRLEIARGEALEEKVSYAAESGVRLRRDGEPAPTAVPMGALGEVSPG